VTEPVACSGLPKTGNLTCRVGRVFLRRSTAAKTPVRFGDSGRSGSSRTCMSSRPIGRTAKSAGIAFDPDPHRRIEGGFFNTFSMYIV